jgi:hypothetical protein
MKKIFSLLCSEDSSLQPSQNFEPCALDQISGPNVDGLPVEDT